MKVVINHDKCAHADAFSTRCLAEMIENPQGVEHYCLAGVIDDGKPELTVTLVFDGQTYVKVLHNRAEREEVMAEGWPAFALPSQTVIPLSQ